MRDRESRTSAGNKAIRAANYFLFLSNYFSFVCSNVKKSLLLESISEAFFPLCSGIGQINYSG